MRKIHFTAEQIENELNEFDILIVGFYAADHYLMIQHSDEHDEQDIVLGFNTYHIERDDQSYGGYGGVKEITLSPQQIKVVPDTKGSRQLKCTEIIARFPSLDLDQLAALQESLSKIFGQAFKMA